MYLAWILGYNRNESPTKTGPLLNCKKELRLMVGEVIMEKSDLGDPGHYTPSFYNLPLPSNQASAKLNRRMQQPLAHLYFFTQFGQVSTEDCSFPPVVDAAKQLYKDCCSGNQGPALMVVSHIELQVLVQVIIKQLAMVISSTDFVILQETISDANRLLRDVHIGSGEGAHGIMIAYHLLQNLKSSEKFVEFMTTKFDKANEIESLREIHMKMQVIKDKIFI